MINLLILVIRRAARRSKNMEPIESSVCSKLSTTWGQSKKRAGDEPAISIAPTERESKTGQLRDGT